MQEKNTRADILRGITDSKFCQTQQNTVTGRNHLHETHPNIIIQQKHIPLLSNTIYNHTPDKYMHRRNAGLYTNTKKSGRSPP